MGPTTVEESLYAYLSGYAGLTALVGTRIYPRLLPDEPTYPAVTYHRISGRNIRTLAPPTVAAVEARFQFSCWGLAYADARNVASQIEDALQDFTGKMGGGVTVLDSNAFTGSDQFDGRVKVHHVPVDAMILYQGGDQ